jgi:hypothetical protein
MPNVIKVLKIFITVVAWLGILMYIFGIFGYSQRITMGPESTPGLIALHIPAYTWVMVIGATLAIIFGLTTRTRLLWPVLIICGIAGSILAIYGISYEKLLSGQLSILIKYLLIFLLPGLACITGGIIIHFLRNRNVVKAN